MSQVEISFSVRMIEQVMAEWQAENPGKNADDMPSAEFARRMMLKAKATARTTP